MEQFSVEKYLKNPSRKVVTKDGNSVRIICTDRLGEHHPVIALVDYDGVGVEKCYGYTAYGKINDNPDVDCHLDLFFIPEKKEKWVNVYEDSDGRNRLGEILYDTEEAAKADPAESRVATVKIEWEE